MQAASGSGTMAAIAFDTLKYARKLKEAGVPEQQAEAQAEGMAEAFLINTEALLTKDYLDARLDASFTAQDARIDRSFATQDARIDRGFANVDGRFERIDGQFNLAYWMLALIMGSTVIPALHRLLT